MNQADDEQEEWVSIFFALLQEDIEGRDEPLPLDELGRRAREIAAMPLSYT